MSAVITHRRPAWWTEPAGVPVRPYRERCLLALAPGSTESVRYASAFVVRVSLSLFDGVAELVARRHRRHRQQLELTQGRAWSAMQAILV